MDIQQTTKSLLCKIFRHDLEWKHVTPDSCRQAQICTRCGHEEGRRFRHNFGEWEHVTPDSCWREQICTRCGHKKDRRVRHNGLEEWEYASPDSCKQVRICRRCGLPVKEKEQHNFIFVSSTREDIPTPYDTDETEIVKHFKCERCGKEVTKVERWV